MPKPKPSDIVEGDGIQEEPLESVPSHPTWSGSISIGLVNIPVRVVPLTIEKKVSFRMLHEKCKTPISYRIFCEEGDEVPKSEIAYGYRLKGHEYLVFDKKEIASIKPESTKVIDLDKFVNFFEVDPHYFESTWLLIPNNSEKPYALLRKTLEQTGLAAIGRMTMSTKERVVLIHHYRDAIVATALRYPDEVRDLSHSPELEDLLEPSEEELALAMKIVDKLTVDLDLSVFHDSYREKIEAMINSKLKGEAVQVEEKKPKKPVAKSMMEALRETAEYLIPVDFNTLEDNIW
jgi:DNA end-binding protein Ku